MKRLVIATTGALLLLMVSADVHQAPAAAATLPVFEETRCPVDLPFGQLEESVLCGYVTVREDYNLNDGRTVKLSVAVLKSTAADPQPDPVFYLTGGPGAPALEGEFQGLGQADAAAFIQSERDFIFYDQRGTGLSEPGLFCGETLDELLVDLANNRSPAEARTNGNMLLEQCRDRLTAEGVDLSAYTSAASAHDIADIASALGYDEYNLMGTSYGTRLALTAMRDTPSRIRSVILDSTVPLQVDVDVQVARDFQRSLTKLFEGCRSDPECAAAYPALEDHLWEVVRRANEEPIPVTINDRNGAPLDIVISGDTILRGTFVALYSARVFRVFPFAIEEVYQGRYGVVQVLAQELVFAFDGFADAMTVSLNCAEETPFYTADAVRAANEGVRQEIIDAEVGVSTEVGRQDAIALCESWGAADVLAKEKKPVVSDIPALILGGEYDPITPPAWGALAGESLSNSQFFEFPSSGHGVFYHHFDCATPMIAAFLAEPTATVDAGCIGEIQPVDFAVGEAPSPEPSRTPGGGPSGISAPDTGVGTVESSHGARKLVALLITGATLIAGGAAVRRRSAASLRG